ncbi:MULTISPECIES: hypothetical protein [Bacillus cereus group]|uniref:hypothetical protein n=1 Tax=Bacillus cereus group TaxID=86661 RepID=UPI0007FB59D2|nr:MULTISPECIES: hypothetical protein [Bacillus cereus group]MCP1395534.1 hypothetical protein [Bacillus cereus]OBW86273.1 hypothetical protein A9L49_24860 [Bacillus cereus]PES49124.1 hypothetical protein CN499_14695 [Bacillus thuringiensis]PEV66438.1 hypothetical protein CN434_19485 [Bacillus thuringiensis]PFC03748.1 hypothetical protein CN302_07255 [Bacillus thuringiensis]
MSKYKLHIDKEQLWKGCVLNSIAHAINVAHCPDFSHESSWDGFNYSMQDSQGRQGTITFHPNYTIVCLQDVNSERIDEWIDAKNYFEGAPSEVIDIAKEEALQYVLEEVEGETVPLITTAFWIEDSGAYSIDSFEEMEEHGGFLLEIPLLDTESAIERLEEEYELTEEQIELLQLVYKKKIQSPNEEIKLSKEEIAMIGTEDSEGLEFSKESFEEMNITWEL